MTLEELIQKKQINAHFEAREDTRRMIVNEKCFKCGSVMSFNYNLGYLHNSDGYVAYRPLRLCVGSCVKCDEFHYGLFYGEKDPVSIFFFPNAEMMNSEFGSFEKFLSENQLSDLRNANKAHNNGLHAGAFLYMRRLLESLVFQVLDEFCEPYTKKESFKDLLNKAETHIELFPKDFSDIRGSFYRFISEGVHGWTDEECSEQYPLAEYAIVRVLTHYKQKRDNEEQNAKLQKAIGEKLNKKRT